MAGEYWIILVALIAAAAALVAFLVNVLRDFAKKKLCEKKDGGS